MSSCRATNAKEDVVKVDCDGVAPDPARDLLRRIVKAWRSNRFGSLDSGLIEEAEALLGIVAEPNTLEAEGA